MQDLNDALPYNETSTLSLRIMLISWATRLRSVLVISIRTISIEGQIPGSLRIFTSKCPLKVQISHGLGPFSQIELLTTGRTVYGMCKLHVQCDEREKGGEYQMRKRQGTQSACSRVKQDSRKRIGMSAGRRPAHARLLAGTTHPGRCCQHRRDLSTCICH